jgi:hypothetical protein
MPRFEPGTSRIWSRRVLTTWPWLRVYRCLLTLQRNSYTRGASLRHDVYTRPSVRISNAWQTFSTSEFLYLIIHAKPYICWSMTGKIHLSGTPVLRCYFHGQMAGLKAGPLQAASVTHIQHAVCPHSCRHPRGDTSACQSMTSSRGNELHLLLGLQ